MLNKKKQVVRIPELSIAWANRIHEVYDKAGMDWGEE